MGRTTIRHATRFLADQVYIGSAAVLAILAVNLPSYKVQFMRTVTVPVQLKHNFSRDRQADVDSNLHTSEPDWFTASADTVLVESFVLYHFCVPWGSFTSTGRMSTANNCKFFSFFLFVWLFSWLKINCKLFLSWLKNNCKLFPSWLKNNCTN